MTSSLLSKKLAFSLKNSLFLFLYYCTISLQAQQLAAYHDNQGRFYIFDNGRTIQAEYLPVKSFSIGGTCLLYADSRNNLKMYYKGNITTLEVNSPDHFIALDYLAVYNIGGIVRIIENGKVTTVTTHAIQYQAEDSVVTFYDADRELLAVYYKGRIQMLEDGLAGKPFNNFKSGDNLVVYVSSRTRDLKIFYQGQNRIIESFISGGSFKAGRDIVAWVNLSDLKFRIFYRGDVFEAEEFTPGSWQTGDGIVAYVDNTGSFKLFSDGETTDISSFAPDFYEVHNRLVIYGEQGYLKVWYNNRSYTLETYIPPDWKAEWNTVVYRDLNRNVKIFSKGESRVLTYDLAEDIELYRDVVVVNKGMNNHNVYYRGKKY
jgi:hypothetical protein